ncbi:site-specific DNA-methyltransferase [Burkholderia vietnamiensis]|uniref:site-specific DNA-methyltransferase n=1 Tax=Burkholderia vietnamiensis TaxID=60552 RepID=UPI001594B103|nr:site-specific DNA-methyltransferase [Burkholderia vietnamiensis]
MKLVTSSRGNLPRQLEREGTLLAQLASLTRPDSYDTTYLTHGVHPYPAKYIPQLPNLIIREHTNERNTVLDPFCGSGTTLLESAILGRKSIGIDSNNVATLISAAKTTALTEDDFAAAEIFLAGANTLKAKRSKKALPGAEELNLSHWFQPNVIAELAAIRDAVGYVTSDALRQFLLCIFSSIIVSVSNQESETRYAAKDKGLEDGDTFRRFFSKLQRELPKVRELSALRTVQRNRPRIHHGDIREAMSLGVKENSVDLIVTSPPYPNSFDYYLYHKWRLFWLGADYRDVMASEIGSRNEHSSKKQPIDVYVAKMREAMIQMSQLLKPSKLAYFFVGDAVLAGKFFNIADVFQDVIKDTDFRLAADTNYSSEAVTRSFREKTSDNCHGGRRHLEKKQHVLVFERINRAKSFLSPVRTRATPLAAAEQIALSEETVRDGSVVALQSKDAARHVHSMGRYPSKFIPDIPRWAITSFSEPGQCILDPFGGSGTTAVEAAMLNRRSISSDVSPYSCLLTEAKTSWMDGAGLKECAIQFAAAIAKGMKGFERAPELFPLHDFWFPSGYLAQIEACKNYIEQNVHKKYRSFMLAVLSTVIRPCSYQDEGQIKVKRDPKKVLQGTPSPFDLLPLALERNVTRKLEYLSATKKGATPKILHASADSLVSSGLIAANSVDLIVTSPPYVNAMNYPMTHRYENLVLGLIEHEEKNLHEREYFGSERVYASEYGTLRQFENEFSASQELNQVLAKIYALEPKRSFIVFRFFSLMFRAIDEFSQALKPGGKFVLVVGRNTIKGVPVDTVRILASMLEAKGLKQQLSFEYEIIKNAFKLTRHATADIIKTDGVGVFEKLARK